MRTNKMNRTSQKHCQYCYHVCKSRMAISMRQQPI